MFLFSTARGRSDGGAALYSTAHANPIVPSQAPLWGRRAQWIIIIIIIASIGAAPSSNNAYARTVGANAIFAVQVTCIWIHD